MYEENKMIGRGDFECRNSVRWLSRATIFVARIETENAVQWREENCKIYNFLSS